MADAALDPSPHPLRPFLPIDAPFIAPTLRQQDDEDDEGDEDEVRGTGAAKGSGQQPFEGGGDTPSLCRQMPSFVQTMPPQEDPAPGSLKRKRGGEEDDDEDEDEEEDE